MCSEGLTADHGRARAELLSTWRAGRLPHALLLTGEPGIGKGELALWIVCLRWCQGEQPPCGRCPSCKKVLTANHPDLEVVRRNPAPEQDPRGLGSRQEITVDQVRQGVIPALGLAAVEGGGRAVIVLAAEDLNEQAQNALLKTLEEPPRGALLVLVTAREEALLDTVRSRCQELRLRPLDAAAMEARAPGCDPLLLSLARGRPGRLPALAALDARSVLETFDGLLAHPAAGTTFGARLAERVQAAAATGPESDEETLRRLVLEILAARIRDLALLESGEEGLALLGGPLADSVDIPSIEVLRGLERALFEAMSDLRRHLPPAVVWAALGIEFVSVLVGGAPSPRRYT